MQASGLESRVPFSMVHHIVLFRFPPDLAQNAVETIFQGLRGLRQRIPGISEFEGDAYNSPQGLATGLTHGFTINCADPAPRDAYLPHPPHQAVGEQIVPMLVGRQKGVLTVDFSDGLIERLCRPAAETHGRVAMSRLL